MIKKLGSALALTAMLTVSTPMPAQSHGICVTACTVAVNDSSVQFAMMPVPNWDCLSYYTGSIWSGLCLLSDGTNCASYYGSTLAVSIPGPTNTIDRVIGNVTISCISGSDQTDIVMPRGMNSATYRFISYCDTNHCGVGVIIQELCEHPAPPPNNGE